MAKKPFTYIEEQEGKVAEYCAANPGFHRQNEVDGCIILTGPDIPDENAVLRVKEEGAE